MASKTVKIIVSNDLVATKPDILFSDCLRVETANKVTLQPNQQTRVNLTVHNTSSLGRMAHLSSNFDSNLLSVRIPDSCVYIAPSGKTVTYAIITALVPAGMGSVSFDVA